MRAFAILTLALATAGVAQTPRPAPRQVRINVSPAGEAVLRRYFSTRDPAIVRDADQLRALGQQMATLAGAPRIDLTRLRALYRQVEAVQADAQRRGNDRTLAMLGELSEADRVTFVRSMRGAATAARPAAR